MSLMDSVISLKGPTSPPIISVMGEPGAGKTQFAVGAPKPIVLRTEDGVVQAVDSFPLIKTFQEAMEQAEAVLTQEHAYQSIVIDSIDHLVALIEEKTCRENKVQFVGDLAYGKGGALVLDAFRGFFKILQRIKEERGMFVVLICHSTLKNVNLPPQPAFDRFEFKLPKAINAFLIESSDVIGMARKNFRIQKETTGFGNSKSRGVGEIEHVLTLTNPAMVTKSRYPVPAEIPLNFDDLLAAMAGNR